MSKPNPLYFDPLCYHEPVTASTGRRVPSGSSCAPVPGSGAQPSGDELALWRSRCAVVSSGDWRDVALYRCCEALIAQRLPL